MSFIRTLIEEVLTLRELQLRDRCFEVDGDDTRQQERKVDSMLVQTHCRLNRMKKAEAKYGEVVPIAFGLAKKLERMQ